MYDEIFDEKILLPDQFQETIFKVWCKNYEGCWYTGISWYISHRFRSINWSKRCRGHEWVQFNTSVHCSFPRPITTRHCFRHRYSPISLINSFSSGRAFANVHRPIKINIKSIAKWKKYTLLIHKLLRNKFTCFHKCIEYKKFKILLLEWYTV